MKRKQQRKNRVALVLVAMLCCFCLQYAAYHFLETADARFVSPIGGENTLIRLQRIGDLNKHGNVNTVFLGSSVTERFLSHGHCATVAISHSPFVSGMRIMNESITFPTGTVYILETNNISKPSVNEITARLDAWDFRCFRGSPFFSLAAKPVNLLLSTIFYPLDRKVSDGETVFEQLSEQPVNLDAFTDLTPQEIEQHKEKLDAIAELQRNGGKVCMVSYPHRSKGGLFDRNHVLACRLAKYAGVPVLDYNKDEWMAHLTFTDQIHLNNKKESTFRFVRSVARDAHRCTQP